MKKFSVTGIILIDCWGDWWLEKNPKFSIFYDQLENFISNNISYHYIISSTDDMARNLKSLPGTHSVCREWLDLEILFGSLTGTWLIGGQTWDICLHHSRIGILELQNKNYHNFLVFSHPKLISTSNPTEILTGQIFMNDKKIKWNNNWTPLNTEFWAIDKFL